MNILVYNGPGVSNLQSILFPFLKSIVGKDYDIIPVDAVTVNNHPWENTTSLFVMPGGRDLPFLHELAPNGTKKILNYVQNGGKYLGICAGAYFASGRVEFEVNRPEFKVVGDRPLRFFPGSAIGSCSKNFSYLNQMGADVLPMTAHLDTDSSFQWNGYVNGGPYFDMSNISQTDAAKYQVLATYDDAMGKGSKPAIVQCHVGKGKALLTGTHFEVGIDYLEAYSRQYASTEEAKWLKDTIIPSLKPYEPHRRSLVSHLLSLLDVKISSTEPTITDLLHVQAPTTIFFYTDPHNAMKILQALASKSEETFGQPELTFIDQADTFMISYGTCDDNFKPESRSLMDEKSLPLRICTNGFPQTPSSLTEFKVNEYFGHLKETRGGDIEEDDFGTHVLVANVVTSTQTILEKNITVLETLPDGTVFVASHQTHGRGRGRNSWISQDGCLQFSMKLIHPSAKSLVFIQYLFSLAVIEGIKSIPSLSNLPTRIKWPNDIYVETKAGLKKIGGILITSQYQRGLFILVIGCGLNVNNASPTSSLLQILQDQNSNGAPSYLSSELILSRILSRFQTLHEKLCKEDSFASFMESYHQNWLHSDQQVTISRDGKETKAQVLGLDLDGFLRAKCLETGKVLQLQPDGNSFDMMQGLITTKFK